MIPHDSTIQEIEGNFETTKMEVTINAQLFKLMTNSLYECKERACVQELVANAYDACIAAGTRKPIHIHTPKQSNPYLQVLDRGTGMDKDTIVNSALAFGNSTKMSNIEVGGFGIGLKALFSISSLFTVESVKDNRLTKATVIMLNGIPQYRVTHDEESELEPYTQISAEVPEEFWDELYNVASTVFSSWEYPIMLNDEPIEQKPLGFTDTIKMVPRNLKNLRSDLESVFIGGFEFNIPWGLESTLRLHKLPMYAEWIIEADIGVLDIAPSRERIEHTSKNTDILQGIIDDFVEQLEWLIPQHKSNVQAVVDKYPTNDLQALSDKDYTLAVSELMDAIDSNIYSSVGINEEIRPFVKQALQIKDTLSFSSASVLEIVMLLRRSSIKLWESVAHQDWYQIPSIEGRVDTRSTTRTVSYGLPYRKILQNMSANYIITDESRASATKRNWTFLHKNGQQNVYDFLITVHDDDYSSFTDLFTNMGMNYEHADTIKEEASEIRKIIRASRPFTPKTPYTQPTDIDTELVHIDMDSAELTVTKSVVPFYETLAKLADKDTTTTSVNIVLHQEFNSNSFVRYPLLNLNTADDVYVLVVPTRRQLNAKLTKDTVAHNNHINVVEGESRITDYMSIKGTVLEPHAKRISAFYSHVVDIRGLTSVFKPEQVVNTLPVQFFEDISMLHERDIEGLDDRFFDNKLHDIHINYTTSVNCYNLNSFIKDMRHTTLPIDKLINMDYLLELLTESFNEVYAEILSRFPDATIED